MTATSENRSPTLQGGEHEPCREREVGPVGEPDEDLGAVGRCGAGVEGDGQRPRRQARRQHGVGEC